MGQNRNVLPIQYRTKQNSSGSVTIFRDDEEFATVRVSRAGGGIGTITSLQFASLIIDGVLKKNDWERSG